jgi:hypothetical protein
MSQLCSTKTEQAAATTASKEGGGFSMNECTAYGPISLPVTVRGAEEDTALYETVHGD